MTWQIPAASNLNACTTANGCAPRPAVFAVNPWKYFLPFSEEAVFFTNAGEAGWAAVATVRLNSPAYLLDGS